MKIVWILSLFPFFSAYPLFLINLLYYHTVFKLYINYHHSKHSLSHKQSHPNSSSVSISWWSLGLTHSSSSREERLWLTLCQIILWKEQCRHLPFVIWFCRTLLKEELSELYVQLWMQLTFVAVRIAIQQIVPFLKLNY